MRKPVLMAAASLLCMAAPAWAQLDASETQVVRGKGPATSTRTGGNTSENIGRSENSTAGNGNPVGTRPAGPNGNPPGRNTRQDSGPNHRVDGRGNIDTTHGTVNSVGSLNGAAPAPEPLTSGSSNEANAAFNRQRGGINGNPSTPGRATPGTANNPGGGIKQGTNGSVNESSNLTGSGGNGNRKGGGNSIGTGLLNTISSQNQNGGPTGGGDNSIFGTVYGNSQGSPDSGTGPEWNGNGPDASDNGAAAKQPKPQGGGASGPNSREKPNTSGGGAQSSEGNKNDKGGSGEKSSGSGEEKQQDHNSGGGKGDGDSGDGGDGGGNDNKPGQANGSPDRPEEDQYGSVNPVAGALAGRRAADIIGRALGRDVTGAHRDEQRQDNEDAGTKIDGRVNVLTGERAVTAPPGTGTSPLLRKIIKDMQEKKKSQ